MEAAMNFIMKDTSPGKLLGGVNLSKNTACFGAKGHLVFAPKSSLLVLQISHLGRWLVWETSNLLVWQWVQKFVRFERTDKISPSFTSKERVEQNCKVALSTQPLKDDERQQQNELTVMSSQCEPNNPHLSEDDIKILVSWIEISENFANIYGTGKKLAIGGSPRSPRHRRTP